MFEGIKDIERFLDDSWKIGIFSNILSYNTFYSPVRYYDAQNNCQAAELKDVSYLWASE
jgi:hypothetical protein